jgi:hypothetical protein
MERCCATGDVRDTPASPKHSKATSLTLLRTSLKFWRGIALGPGRSRSQRPCGAPLDSGRWKNRR